MLSIAMTTYNGEKYIPEQIESILAQTISDFELIICDDVSKDKTIEILKKYAKKDSRIKLYCNKTNLGFKKNFEQAVKLCKGEYIALCDQDDVWEKNHLEVLLNNIGNNYLIAGNNLLVDQNLNSLNQSFFESHLFSTTKYPDNIDILKKVLLSGNCFQGASMLLKKDILKFYLPLPEKIPYHDSWLSVIACSLNKFTCTDTIVTKYRQHNHQVTQNKVDNTFINDRLEFCKEIKNRKLKIDSYTENFLNQLYKYFQNQDSIYKKIRQFSFWKKNYSFIYPDNNKTKKILRFMKFVLKNQIAKTQILKQLTFEEIKKCEQNILEQFTAFCDKNNLRYYLAYGTLIGALRNKGFIPWDDDVDVNMPRKDYNEFISLLAKQNNLISDNIEIKTPSSKKYQYPFVKVIDNTTFVQEKTMKKKYKTSVWIDIFPMDKVPEQKNEREKFINKIKKMDKYYFYTIERKYSGSDLIGKIKFNILRILFTPVYSIINQKKRIDEFAQKYENSSFNTYSELIINPKADLCIMNSDDFKQTKVTFEGKLYTTFLNYDKVLKDYYGDYMQLPPENKRILAHSLTAYKK